LYNHCLSSCLLSYDYCIVCPSSNDYCIDHYTNDQCSCALNLISAILLIHMFKYKMTKSHSFIRMSIHSWNCKYTNHKIRLKIVNAAICSRAVPLCHLYSGRRTSLSLILVGARVVQFLVFFAMFYLFVFSFKPLYCLSFDPHILLLMLKNLVMNHIQW
jgi:hypothetical protein